jgi:predicted acylesterase/phospholipase RssA
MGKVVQLDGPEGRPRGARGMRRRRRGEKTALVLGGGGFTGGVYEMGALRAFDLLAVNRTVNEFDIYVGTSAGAFVASMVANGITPESSTRRCLRRLRTRPSARCSGPTTRASPAASRSCHFA